MQLTSRQINYCMECGVCTGSCPVSQADERFSPRQIIKRTLVHPKEDLAFNRHVWSCLTCARCSDRCPVGIDFPEFIRSYRGKAQDVGNLPRESHHGIFQSLARLQTHDLNQKRTAWAEEAGSIKKSGEYYFFSGCLPFFQTVFRYLELDCLSQARSIIKLLNAMGIEPAMSDQERCCGHDALWNGNVELFRSLGEKNLEVIKETGAKKVLFSCPEGYLTFKRHYPEYFGELPFEVIHISELLAQELPKADVAFKPSENGVLTYHDPCRLGRWSGIYEAPRELLRLIPGVQLQEMQRNRENALCCGTTGWMECSACSKAMQLERLEEARQTGASSLITSCPKCQIHFSCALKNTDFELGIKDIYTALAEAVEERAAQSA